MMDNDLSSGTDENKLEQDVVELQEDFRLNPDHVEEDSTKAGNTRHLWQKIEFPAGYLTAGDALEVAHQYGKIPQQIIPGAWETTGARTFSWDRGETTDTDLVVRSSVDGAATIWVMLI